MFEISGGPGRGKTTVIQYLIKELRIKPDRVYFLTFIGRAALVLRMNGNKNAFTIHKVIYDIVEEPLIITNARGKKEKIHTGKLTMALRKCLPKEVDLIVLDEARMVPENIAMDLLSFGKPIIALGDIYQLPPVMGNPFFLNNPDIILREPMRQLADSHILKLCDDILAGKDIPLGVSPDKSVWVIRQDEVTSQLFLSDKSQVLVGRNSTRRDINKYVREELYGRYSNKPVVGDRLIVRKNNWNRELNGDLALVNGLLGTCNHVYGSNRENKADPVIDFQPDGYYDYFQELPIDRTFLNTGEENNRFNNSDKLEYGYAITTHLAQGSEFPAVVVYDESDVFRSYKREWLNTAVSRAKKLVVLVKMN